MCTLETIELRSRSSSIHHGSRQYILMLKKFYTLVFNLSRANSTVRRSRMIAQKLSDSTINLEMDQAQKLSNMHSMQRSWLSYVIIIILLYLLLSINLHILYSLHTTCLSRSRYESNESNNVLFSCCYFAANLSHKYLLFGWSFCDNIEYQWNSRNFLK